MRERELDNQKVRAGESWFVFRLVILKSSGFLGSCVGLEDLSGIYKEVGFKCFVCARN